MLLRLIRGAFFVGASLGCADLRAQLRFEL
jgi:hypothetical protein